MRRLIMSMLAASCAAYGQQDPLIPRIAWTVETSDPRQRPLELRYGETVDLEARIQNYQFPMDIGGSAVTLHARTNGMSEGVSFQCPGAARAGGVAAVRVPVSAWVPHGLREGRYTLAVVQTNGAAVLRVEGPLRVLPTAAAAGADPVPVAWVAGLVTTQQLAAAIGGIPPPSVLSVNAQTGHIEITASDIGAAETDDIIIALDAHDADPAAHPDIRALIAAIPTNAPVTRWTDSSDSNIWWEAHGGTNLMSYKAEIFDGEALRMTYDNPDSLLAGMYYPTHQPLECGNSIWTNVNGNGVIWYCFDSYYLGNVPYAYSWFRDRPWGLDGQWMGYEESGPPFPFSELLSGAITNIVASHNLVTGNVWQAVAEAKQEADAAYIHASNAMGVINNHTQGGTIGADKHLLAGDREKIDAIDGLAGLLTNGLWIAATAGTMHEAAFSFFPAFSGYVFSGQAFTTSSVSFFVRPYIYDPAGRRLMVVLGCPTTASAPTYQAMAGMDFSVSIDNGAPFTVRPSLVAFDSARAALFDLSGHPVPAGPREGQAWLGPALRFTAPAPFANVQHSPVFLGLYR